MSDLAVMLALLEAGARAAQERLRERGRAGVTSETRIGIDLEIGCQVWDLVTGQKGVILAATRTNHLAARSQG